MFGGFRCQAPSDKRFTPPQPILTGAARVLWFKPPTTSVHNFTPSVLTNFREPSGTPWPRRIEWLLLSLDGCLHNIDGYTELCYIIRSTSLMIGPNVQKIGRFCRTVQHVSAFVGTNNRTAVFCRAGRPAKQTLLRVVLIMIFNVKMSDTICVT